MGVNIIPLVDFPFNNSETVKTVTWVFCKILIEAFVPNLTPLTRPSLQVLGKTQTGVFHKILSYSRTNHDIDMKLGPITKFDKRNPTMSKKFDDYAMPANCDVIVFFLIYGQFAANWKPDTGRIVGKLTFSLTTIFYLTKTENRTKKCRTELPYYCFE